MLALWNAQYLLNLLTANSSAWTLLQAVGIRSAFDGLTHTHILLRGCFSSFWNWAQRYRAGSSTATVIPPWLPCAALLEQQMLQGRCQGCREIHLAQEDWLMEFALLVSVHFLCLDAHLTIHVVIQGVLVLWRGIKIIECLILHTCASVREPFKVSEMVM